MYLTWIILRKLKTFVIWVNDQPLEGQKPRWWWPITNLELKQLHFEFDIRRNSQTQSVLLHLLNHQHQPKKRITVLWTNPRESTDPSKRRTRPWTYSDTTVVGAAAGKPALWGKPEHVWHQVAICHRLFCVLSCPWEYFDGFSSTRIKIGKQTLDLRKTKDNEKSKTKVCNKSTPCRWNVKIKYKL